MKSGMYEIWTDLVSSFPAQMFVVSVLFLLSGLLSRVWSNAVHIKHLEPVTLDKIEKKHPHIPSVKVITASGICSVSMMLAAYLALQGVTPFEGPYESLFLIGFFVLAGSGAILAELNFKDAKELPFAFVIGSSLALIFLAFRHSLPRATVIETTMVLAVLVLSLILARKILFPSWTHRVQLVSVAIFVLWILVYY